MSQEEFSIPIPLLEKVYEVSGGADHHKGVLLFYINNAGRPMIYHKVDSSATDAALLFTAKNFVDNASSAFQRGIAE